MKNIDTHHIDIAWPASDGALDKFTVSNEILVMLCAPLIGLVRGRKARGGSIPDRQEVAKRVFLCKLFENLGVTKVEGKGWKVSYVPTRFRTIGDEMIPIADESLRVTIAKTPTFEAKGRLAVVR